MEGSQSVPLSCRRGDESLLASWYVRRKANAFPPSRPAARRHAHSTASREAEPEVVVAEGRIELAAQRDAADRVHVAPRSAARGAPHALVRARGIPLRRSAVVVLVVPVGAPLVHVCCDAEKAEIGRLAEGHGPWRL